MPLALWRGKNSDIFTALKRVDTHINFYFRLYCDMMRENNPYGQNRDPRYNNQAPYNKGAMGVSGASSNRTNAGGANPSRARNGHGQSPQNGPRYADPRNLRDQMPNVRRQRQGATAADFENLRRINKQRQFKIKKKRQKMMRRLIRRSIAVLAIYFVLLTLSAVIMYTNMNTYTTEETHDYVYQTGIDKDPARRTREASWKTVYMNDTRYINFTELADLCEMTTTGDSKQLRFITLNGEIVEFNLGTSLVYINNVATRLNEDVIYSSGTLYVPMEFAQRYMLGVTVTYNEKTYKIISGRNGSYDLKGNFVYDDVSFIIKPQLPSSNIPLESLSYQILAQTVLPKPAEPSGGAEASDTAPATP